MEESRERTEVLGAETCRRLLADHVGETGHVALNAECMPLIVPAVYTLEGGDVVVADGGGSLRLGEDNVVAFAVDGLDDVGRRWCVLVRGRAHPAGRSSTSAGLLRIAAELVTGTREGMPLTGRGRST